VEDHCKLFAVVPLSVIQSSSLKQKLLGPLITYCCSVAERWMVNSGRDIASLSILVKNE